MMIKKLMEKQFEFDKWIGEGKRERNEYDIVNSINAEIVELNEELPNKYRHKTWKPKEYNETAMKKELVDILFFILQMNNLTLDMSTQYEDLDTAIETGITAGLRTDEKIPLPKMAKLFRLVNGIDFRHVAVLVCYGEIVGRLGVTFDELVELYNVKMEENFNRPDFIKARG